MFKIAVQAYLVASSLADDGVGQVLDAMEKRYSPMYELLRLADQSRR